MKKRLASSVALLSLVLLVGCAQSGGNSSTSSSLSSVTSSSSVSSVNSSLPQLTHKTVEAYTLSSTNPTHSFELTFLDGDESIPYITLEELVSYFRFFHQVNGFTTYGLTLTENAGVYTLTRENGSMVLFDVDQQAIRFSSHSAFFAYPWTLSALDVVSFNASLTDGKGDYLERFKDTAMVRSGGEYTIDLTPYGISMLLEEGKLYLPLASFGDLFFSPLGFALLYNGQALFVTIQGLNDMGDLYYSAKTGSRSASLAEFSYHELCLNLDMNYGLKDALNITSMDDFFGKMGRREDLMSTDEAKVQDALSYLVMDDFDDGHSNTLGPSYLLGSDYDIHADKFNGVSNTAYNKRMAIFSAARTSALGTYKPYEVVDDTAYVTFDEFKSQQSDYYASFPSEAQASQDTMALVGYSHKQILANSAIKNVVVDLSCNGGGEINACAYIASWLTGDTTITEQNPNNHCFASTIYRADTNYDNTYDADDTLQGRGLHLYCLTSLCSFSCGNLLPNLCKNAHNVSLIGQHTGGGACAVQTTSMADGTYFRISGCSRLCNSLNGTLYNVDAGVEPDYYLQNAASYYNRDQLSKYLDTLL
jgi:hypothetical protein